MGPRSVVSARSLTLGGVGIFAVFVVAFLVIAFGSKAQVQNPPASGCGDPPWNNPGGKCGFAQKTSVSAHTVNWPKRTPPETDCYLTILVCNFKLQRDTKNPIGTKCPEEKDFAQPTFCCTEFDKAVKTKQPCDPMKDADCDGLPNDTDPDPLAGPDPDADDKCKQLKVDVFTAYKKAGASDSSAGDASTAAGADCVKRRKNKMCGITTPAPPYVPFPRYEDEKCKQLALDVQAAYLHAGADDLTAAYGGDGARADCLRRKYGKL